ncbi:hypothetical protein RhiirA5_417504 [Rhizophagus irregularis]|uniref:BTB domain-containing protein n=1 Tax=Rhizophagus irregularis TaxID=588596 RepID=A0A2N0PMF9_9GLOM|nr:hypothetical protein RhiirA5_417504 [Rhizophagus irregularis]
MKENKDDDSDIFAGVYRGSNKKKEVSVVKDLGTLLYAFVLHHRRQSKFKRITERTQSVHGADEWQYKKRDFKQMVVQYQTSSLYNVFEVQTRCLNTYRANNTYLKNDHLSEFFPENFGLLYNGMKESYETQICFPTFNSSEMKIILEYAYTGSVREETLTDNNIID